MTAPAALGRPDALFEPTPALMTGRMGPTAAYLAARAALRTRPVVEPRSRSSGAQGRAVETVWLPRRRARQHQNRDVHRGRWGGREDRLRSADGHGWTWTDTARVGNGPTAYGRVPSPLRIARAIPPGHRRAPQAHRWLARVRETALAEFRLDAAERRIALAVVAARHLDVATGTYAGGWDRLAHLVGVSRSTVARFLAWLRARSLLGVVSTGRRLDTTTPLALVGDVRGPDGETVNEAAVYVPCEPDTPVLRQPPDPGLVALDPRWHTGDLTVGDDGRVVADRSRHPRAADDPTTATTGPSSPAPARRGPGGGAVDETDTPKWSSEAGTQNGRAHAPDCTATRAPAATPLRGGNNAATRQHPPDQPESTGPADSPARSGPCPTCGPWPTHQPARTRADRLRIAHQLRRASPDLTPLSARLLRHLLRPWLTAGWTAADVQHAIDHHPTDGPRRHSPTTGGPGTIHNPAGWLVVRMRDWRTPDGGPAPSHRERVAAIRAAGTYARSPADGGEPPAAGNPVPWPAVRTAPDPPAAPGAPPDHAAPLDDPDAHLTPPPSDPQSP